MKRVLVLETGWLEYAGDFKKHGIELVRSRASSPESTDVDAIVAPASAWPVGMSRKRVVPIVVYGAPHELRDLRDESTAGFLMSVDALTTEGVIEALQTLWREGPAGEELEFEEQISTLPPREREAARGWREGETRADTAKRLGVAESTVRSWRSSIRAKLGSTFPEAR